MTRGFITKIWGPHLWFSLHTITFGYPDHPTQEDKENYYNFFKYLGPVLPCEYCRKSYSYFIESEPTKLTMDILNDRNNLTKWLYQLHERVNNKLDVVYDVSYDDVVEKYESFKAICTPTSKGCLMPLNLKSISYQNADKKDCPIINYKMALAIKDYAKKRNVIFDKLEYYEHLKHNKKNKEWEQRNIECNHIISKMRIEGIDSIERDGEYKGLPTTEELILISKLSSNLTNTELFEVTKKLNKPVYSVYKLNF